MSLRSNLSIVVLLVALFSLGAAFSLVALTGYLQRTSTEVVSDLHSIRLLQELELDLRDHARASDPTQRMVLQRELRRKLEDTRQYIGSPDEERAFLDTREKLETYFTVVDGGHVPILDLPELDSAFAALTRLLDINAAESAETERQAAQWDALIDRTVIVVTTALFLAVLFVLLWLWRFAFQPVLEIRDAMMAFAAGSKTSRALEEGPEELRGVAIQFNQMAEALARQHENQLVFLTGVAHDLRNPLFPLKMSATLLGTDGPLPSQERVRNIVEVIQRQVDRLDRMIGDLLDASKIEAGHLELRMEEYDARTLVREVHDLFNEASPKHRFELIEPKTPVIVRCDPYRIEQVLNNLVSNAIKYSPSGGGIRIAVEATNEGIVFTVADEGVGIRNEDLPYIFEPFRRIRSAGPDIPGIGLGLSISRRIIEAHNGRIDLKSLPGKGTTFRILLPPVTSAERDVA